MIAGRMNTQCDDRLVYVVGAAVPEDARRRRFAETLVEDMVCAAAHDAKTIIQATCRCDIAANSFWHALGFVPVFARFTHSTRGKPCIVWRRHIDGEQSDLLEYKPPARARLSGGRYAPKAANALQQPLWVDLPIDSLQTERITDDVEEVLSLIDRSPLTSGERVAALQRLRLAHDVHKAAAHP